MSQHRSTWASPPVVTVPGWAQLGTVQSVHTAVYSELSRTVPGLGGSVNGVLLQDLNWPTLQYRWQRARLSLFCKSLYNLVALEILPYYILQTIIHPHYITSYPISIPMLEPICIASF